MRQRGRKSTADLVGVNVDSSPPRLNPPASLSEAEQSLFIELVAANAPEHFRPSDLPLLARYCEATVLAEQAARELRHGAVVGGKVSPWLTVQEKAIRAAVALSMRLRLSPQSRIDAKSLGRQVPYMGPKPWEIGRNED